MGWHNVHPIVVPDNPESLHGPTSGTVTLPISLDWSPNPTYDLSRHRRVVMLYKTVLLESSSEEEMGHYVSWGVLKRVWSDLMLPKFCQDAWESRYPELRGC
jgi:hypothetical protein